MWEKQTSSYLFVCYFQMDESLDISAIQEVETSSHYHCTDCGYTTRDKSNFTKHRKNVHGIGKDQPDTSTPLKEVKKGRGYMCDTCGKMYKTSYSLKLHTKNKHSLTFKHTCNVCKKGFNQTTQYRCHVAKHAQIPLSKCQFCKAELFGHSSIRRHMEVCTAKDPNKTFVCDLCQVSFSRKYKMDEHMKGKHGPATYSCTCGKRYSWRSSLKFHTKICHNKSD